MHRTPSRPRWTSSTRHRPRPAARQAAGLPGLGGAKVKIVFADHQADPQKGRAEAERLITQEKVCALIGTYQSAVAVTVSQICERYQIPFVSADNSSPSLHRRGLKFYFRASPHDEMFSEAMFDFFDDLKKKGKKIETLSLFHEDTIFGTDSGNAQPKLADERGYKVTRQHQIPCELALPHRRGAAAQGGRRRRADALELHDRRHPAGQDHGGARLQAEGDRRAGCGLLREGALRRRRRQDRRRDHARSFSLDLAAKRPSVGKINEMFKASSGKDLNDLTSREFMGLIVLADGIDRAKSTDGEKIRDALAATDIPGERTIMPWKQ